MIFTADHGNADEMYVEKEGEKTPKTSHSLNPVPFAIFDPLYNQEYKMNTNIKGGLANVATTVFNLMGYKSPEEYEPSLIEFNKV